MVSFNLKNTAAVAAAAYLAVQQAPCPQVAIPLIAEAALTTAGQVGSAMASFGGAIVGAHFGGGKNRIRAYDNLQLNERGDFTAPPGVPQQEFDRCYNDLVNPDVSVTTQGPVGNNGIRVSGLPASCMNLATVITGDANGPPPYACGSDCLMYDNLDEKNYNSLRDTFYKLKNA